MDGIQNPAYVGDTDNVVVTHTNQAQPPDSSVKIIHESKSEPLNLNNKSNGNTGGTFNNLSTAESGYGSKSVLVDNDTGVFQGDNFDKKARLSDLNANIDFKKQSLPDDDDKDEHDTGRDTWGKDIEFLLSCVAMSVGLGNYFIF